MSSSPILLEFSPEDTDLRNDLSAVVLVGDHLWLASDENISLERLKRNADGGFSEPQSYSLSGILDLPAEGNDDLDQEIDIEGLAFHDGYLWLTGSHSVKRKKAESKKGREEKKGRKRLAEQEAEGNRYLIARVPLSDPFGDDPTPLKKVEADGRTAAQLRGTASGNALMAAIRSANEGRNGGDEHLGRFLALPGKENGFDIEGIAVNGQRTFLGLRGPVLRGWSVILEIELEEKEDRRLALREIGPDGALYRKHFLQLDGLGIRDLAVSGEDLLILAGPSMDHDGPIVIHRWKGGADPEGERMLWRDSFSEPVTVPWRQGADRAEGMCLFPIDESISHLLIVYDAPHADRLVAPAGVMADLFQAPV